MADLSKHSVVESLNISSSANHSVQSAQSVSTSSEYNLNVSYDPCSYPGIQCKYKQDGKRQN